MGRKKKTDEVVEVKEKSVNKKLPKKKMTMQEVQELDDLYQYVKTLMGYDENQALPSSYVMRLKGLRVNKFYENYNQEDTANYSYTVLLNTFKLCSPIIKKGFETKTFSNEGHKFNYMLAIVEPKINDIYIRMKNVEKAKEKMEMRDISIYEHKGVEYTPDKNKKYKYDDLW